MALWIALAVSAILFAATASLVAHERGGDAISAFFLGLVFGPFGAVWAYYLCDKDSYDARLIDAGRRKLCPSCQEVARPKAEVCPHCQFDFTALQLRKVS